MIFLYSSILFHSTVFNMSPKFHIVQTLQSFQYSQSLTIVVKMVWKRVEKFLLNKSSSCWLLIFHKAITRDLHAGMFYLHLQTCSQFPSQYPSFVSQLIFSRSLLVFLSFSFQMVSSSLQPLIHCSSLDMVFGKKMLSTQ